MARWAKHGAIKSKEAGVEYRCFVGGLAQAVDDATLESAFEPCHAVCAKVTVDARSGKSQGFGFVTFRDEGAMNNAVQLLDGVLLHGKRISVSAATSTAKPEAKVNKASVVASAVAAESSKDRGGASAFRRAFTFDSGKAAQGEAPGASTIGRSYTVSRYGRFSGKAFGEEQASSDSGRARQSHPLPSSTTHRHSLANHECALGPGPSPGPGSRPSPSKTAASVTGQLATPPPTSPTDRRRGTFQVFRSFLSFGANKNDDAPRR